MKKLIFISFVVFFTLTPAFGQRGKNKTLQKEALDDVKVLSSKNYPYIELFHQAVREKMSGNFTEAKKLFNDCLKEKQDDDAVYFGLAEIAKAENNLSEALQNYKKAYKIDPNNNVYLQELAYIHAERANFEEAELLFKKMCDLEPRNVDFIYGYSRILIYNKAYELAIEQLNKLQDQVGIIPDIMSMKADLYTELKQPDKAEEIILQLKNEFPEDLEVLKNVIGFYEQQGEREKALRFIEELVENDSENANAHFVLANNYLEQNKIDEFIKIAPKLFRLKGLDVDQKLLILEQLGQYIKPDDSLILDATNELYKAHPNNEFVLLNHGNSLVIQRQTKEALVLFRKAVKISPNNFEAWMSLLSFESEYLEYESLYLDGYDAIDLFPTMPFVYFSAAEGALYTNRTDEAIQLLAAGELYLLDNKIQSALYDMRKGQVYFVKNEFKKGIVAFEKALNTDQVNPNIKINYALSLAKANIAQDVAKELLSNIKEENKSPDYYKAKALIDLNSNQIKKGIKTLEIGIEQLFNNAELYDLLGDLHFKNQSAEEALKAWENAQKNESRNKVLSKKIKEVKYYAPNYN